MNQKQIDTSTEQVNQDYSAVIKEQKKKLIQTTLLALTTLGALVFVCVAWFISNRQVDMQQIDFNTSTDVFELAAKGDDTGFYSGLLTFEDGSEYEFEDEDTGTKTDSQHTKIKWVMNDDSNMNNIKNIYGESSIQPGSYGKMTFYVIPAIDGDLTIEFDLTADLYVEASSTEEGAKKIGKLGYIKQQNDEEAATLFSGHILFFRSMDSTTGLYGDMIEDGHFVETFKSAKAGKEYPVTIYWTWVYVFGQTLLPSDGIVASWFDDDVRAELLADMKENSNKYFCEYKLSNNADYTSIDVPDGKLENIFNNKYVNDEFVEISGYYNNADEYIGDKIRYIVLTLGASKSVDDE